MAANDINLKINLDDYGSVSTIGELKKQLKDLKSAALEAGEGSVAFDKITQKAGELNDKITRVNENIRANTGNAVENATRGLTNIASVGVGAFSALQGAAALFGNESKGLQETLVKLNGAMALSQGLKSLAEAPDVIRDSVAAFKSLNIVTKANQLLTSLAATAQTAFAAATGGVTISMEALKIAIATTGIGLLIVGVGILATKFTSLSGDVDKSTESMTKFNYSISQVSGSIDQYVETEQKSYDVAKRTLELAKLRGASAGELLKLENSLIDASTNLANAKKKHFETDVKDTNERIFKLQDELKLNGKLSEEKQKDLDDLISLRNSENDQILQLGKKIDEDAFDRVKLTVGYNKKKADDAKDNLDKVAKDEDEFTKKYKEELEKRKKASDDETQSYLSNMRLRRGENESTLNAIVDSETLLTESIGTETLDRQTLHNEQMTSQLDAEKVGAENYKKIQAEKFNVGLQIAQTSFNALGGLSDIYFQGELDKVKKGSKEEEKIKRKAFAVNKALQVSTAIISGIQSVQSALATPPGPPYTIPFGIAAGALSAVNVAKILATNFDSTNSGGMAPSGGGGSVGDITSQQPATFTAPQFFGLGNQTNPNGGSGQSPLQVYVLENDITNAQQNVLGYIQTSVLNLGKPENTNGPFGPI